MEGSGLSTNLPRFWLNLKVFQWLNSFYPCLVQPRWRLLGKLLLHRQDPSSTLGKAPIEAPIILRSRVPAELFSDFSDSCWPL